MKMVFNQKIVENILKTVKSKRETFSRVLEIPDTLIFEFILGISNSYAI